VNSILTNWKSNLNGFLTATLVTSAAFLSPPLNTLVSAKVILWIGAFQIIGKLWISLLTKDADKITTPDIVKANAVAQENATVQPAVKAQ
jgi:hypothetical protein